MHFFRHAAEAGIQGFKNQVFFWTPVFTGVTTFYNLINNVNYAIGYDILKNALAARIISTAAAD